ncbi:MAG TPA: hypothetical protein VF088_01475 [Pyrinomonadaceae bacterium]
MIFRFTPEADAELTEAREWYSHQRDDLDIEFMQCIEDALSRILANPHMFPAVHGDLRRAIVRRASRVRRMGPRATTSATRLPRAAG